MKKVVSILLAALMLFSTLALASCGNSSGSGAKLKVVDIPLTEEKYAFAVPKGEDELLAQLNTFLAEIKENGEFDKMVNNYFGDGTPNAVVSAEKDASKDQLVVATNLAFAPFEYLDGENIYGLDMEIMAAFAASIGKELVIDNMEFDSVCLSVSEGICDIGASGLTVNEKRKEILNFSSDYYDAGQLLIVKADDTTFDNCKTAEDVVAILNTLTADDKIGVQTGTTAQLYIEGSEDMGFPGLPASCATYETFPTAAENILHGNVKYALADSAPAREIVDQINAVG